MAGTSRDTGIKGFCTVEQHILSKQGEHPHATGAFSSVLTGIMLAGRIISAKVRRAGILDVLGETSEVNVHGEQQQKLDQIANKALETCLCYRESVGIIASEELDEPRIVRETSGKYVIIFDPLDGSSNIDVNVSVGTIFSIFERGTHNGAGHDHLADVLQPGRKQVAAGYIVYGSSTVMCYSTGEGVHMFTLDPSVGLFL
ncbi:MAG TPA: class 1 fructose-bisphosphatase, partial [Phycisphaerae bacterium]|nr:class 1 fructose-bisphosphatase [Phycisphaerae bacterium]